MFFYFLERGYPGRNDFKTVAGLKLSEIYEIPNFIISDLMFAYSTKMIFDQR